MALFAVTAAPVGFRREAYSPGREMTVSTPDSDDEMEELTVVTMVDEDGAEEEFALLDMIEVDGRHYGLFSPVEELEDDGDEDVEGDEADEDEEHATGILVLRAVQRGAEQDFEMIEDDEEFDRIQKHLDKVASSFQANFGTSVNNN
jgi:uncharacterized protein YrzB (UPF0473 family)